METLKKLRKAAKRTQVQMANYLGITQQAYAMYELGTRTPPIDVIQKIADYFNVTIDYILERNNDNTWTTKTEIRDEDSKPIYPNLSPELLDLLNALTPEQQEKAIVFIKGMLA